MRNALTIALLLCAATLRADFREFSEVPRDPSNETKVRHAAEDLAISVVAVTNPATISRGYVGGDAPFYPASVITPQKVAAKIREWRT